MIEKTAEKTFAPQVPHSGTALNLQKKEAVPAKISADPERGFVLRVGEALFRKGQPKIAVYRVEAGVVFTSSGGDDLSQRSFDMAEPGDFVGLGFLEHHSTSAFAMTDCVVSSFSQTEFGELADQDVIHAGCAGVPVYLLSRNPMKPTYGITTSLEKAFKAVDEEFESFFSNAGSILKGPSFDYYGIFEQKDFPEWDNEFITRLYIKTWDLLWRWSVDGVVEEQVNNAIKESGGWQV